MWFLRLVKQKKRSNRFLNNKEKHEQYAQQNYSFSWKSYGDAMVFSFNPKRFPFDCYHEKAINKI